MTWVREHPLVERYPWSALNDPWLAFDRYFDDLRYQAAKLLSDAQARADLINSSPIEEVSEESDNAKLSDAAERQAFINDLVKQGTNRAWLTSTRSGPELAWVGGFSVNGGFIVGLGAEVTIGVLVDGHGNVGVFFTPAGRVGLGAGVDAGVGIVMSSADGIPDFGGATLGGGAIIPPFAVGASGGWGDKPRACTEPGQPVPSSRGFTNGGATLPVSSINRVKLGGSLGLALFGTGGYTFTAWSSTRPEIDLSMPPYP